jgi:phosphoenolpyruvate---glycerone phosphotransferase subunit DhaM
MSDETRVGIVLVSHSAALAEGTAEVAGQIGGGSVIIVPAGGTDDGGIGTSIARVREALHKAGTGAGVVILPDLGSSVLTVRALLAEEDFPYPVAMADAPFVEGAVAATVTAAAGGDVGAVLRAAEEARHASKL